MKQPRYSSSIRHSTRRFPTPERPLLDRILARVKEDVKNTHDYDWWAAGVATVGELSKLRKKLRAAHG
ncbi:hypothetical protein [Hymenobacter mucosus]|uniref:Uncharacterized protein n=1 Tax=Hymenobacter mucosus TaxID=1411120 RepID=A0A239A842_9BACT|nr:hypothetical protein [Hymenobacter mucosus]SNR91740.1 hypothetical protein SAMN06269173_11150 [Hymenobacter mucosus]